MAEGQSKKKEAMMEGGHEEEICDIPTKSNPDEKGLAGMFEMMMCR